VKTKPKQVNHFAVADLCRANPGEWQDVGEYNSSQTAAGLVEWVCNARITKSGRRSAYSPAGAFEARRELTEYGARVEARFVSAAGTEARS
jgi:hypothetical protein